MQYYIKPKKREQGPYTKEQLVKMLGSLKIGRKTPCRPDDGSATRMFPLEKVVPEVVEAIQKQRGKAKKARREESGLRKKRPPKRAARRAHYGHHRNGTP
jgi:hypothetical protein